MTSGQCCINTQGPRPCARPPPVRSLFIQSAARQASQQFFIRAQALQPRLHDCVLKMTETTFTLIHTNKSRGGGDDDYDVCDGDKVIGRIVRHPQRRWKHLGFGITTEGTGRSWLTDRGYAVSREHALAQFRARWTLNELVWHRVVDLPTPPMPAFIVRCVQCNAQIWVALDSPSDVRRICLRCAKSVSRSP